MSDSEEDDDYATFGTPLEPIDEDSVPRKKPFALEDQVVKDKQGRRRFHGAFTGGFSAGFFNSVGSLEGWKPSTFTSSRAEKAGKVAQKPEDFMDDEDMDEYGIAPKVLRATADYNDQRGKKRERPQQSDGPIPGKPVLETLLQPSKDTVGIKLLKRMGWKPGQGVGPRLSKVEKRRLNREHQQASGKVYGCSLPDFTLPRSDDDDDGGSSDEEVDITFAPDDYEPFLCKPKDNCFGIGYVGLDKRPILSSHINLFEPSLLQMTDKNKKVNISGQAFGVGAFEEDDADIYARDDMTQYDFALESTSKAKPKQRKARWSAGAPPPVPCLEGFDPAAIVTVRKKYFPPPPLPRDFQPVHVARKTRFDPAPVKDSNEGQSRRRGLERHNLTADDRSYIIGDKVSGPTTTVPSVQTDIPTKDSDAVDSSTSIAVSSVSSTGTFRPFVAQPDKQRRYEQFLGLGKPEQQEGLLRLQPLSMLEWEREHERMEFEQASRLYRPMTGVMNDRFVSATQQDDTLNPLAVVERTCTDADKDLVAAAKMKMFGRLTRERSEWRPTSLLCKRFNIPEPFTSSGSSLSSVAQKKTSKFSVFDFLDAAKQNTSRPALREEVKEEKQHDSAKSVENVEHVAQQTVVEVEVAVEAVEAPKSSKDIDLEFPDLPEKIDLFKAIFLSSSEDSGSDDDKEAEVISSATATSAIIPESQSIEENPVVTIPEEVKNVVRNTSPPRGIFANLDLDSINRKVDSSKTESKEIEIIDLDNELPTDMFGPRLPSGPQTSVSAEIRTKNRSRSDSDSGSEEDSDSSNQWVEKPSKSSRKEKSSRPSKHKKHKKTSKHKKHKSHKTHKTHKTHKKKHKKK